MELAVHVEVTMNGLYSNVSSTVSSSQHLTLSASSLVMFMSAYDNSPARSLLPLWIFLSMIIPPPIPVPTTTTAAFVAVLALPSHNSARAAHLPSFSRATDTPPHAFDMRSPRCAPSRYLIPPPPYTMPRSTSICPGSPMAIPVMSQSSTFSSYTFLICATNAGVPASAYLSVGVLPFPDILPSSSINAYFINVAPTSNTKYISPSCFSHLPVHNNLCNLLIIHCALCVQYYFYCIIAKSQPWFFQTHILKCINMPSFTKLLDSA